MHVCSNAALLGPLRLSCEDVLFFFRKKEKTKGHMAFPSLLSRPRNRQLASRCALPVRRLSKGAFLARPPPLHPPTDKSPQWTRRLVKFGTAACSRRRVLTAGYRTTTDRKHDDGRPGTRRGGISGGTVWHSRKWKFLHLVQKNYTDAAFIFFYVFFLSDTELQLMTLFLRVNKNWTNYFVSVLLLLNI